MKPWRWLFFPVILSNAATSATNFTLVLGVQASGGSRAVGAFALVSAPWVLGLTVQRNLAGQILLVDERGKRRRQLFHVVLLGGLVLAGIGVCVAIAGGSATLVMLPLAVGIPFALGQDYFRYVCFGRQKAHYALGSDLVWLVVVIGAIVLAHTGTGGSPRAVAAMWTLGAIMALGVGLALLRWRRPSALGVRSKPAGLFTLRVLLVESVLVLIMGQILVFGVAALVSLHDLGLFRFASALLAPQLLVGSALVGHLVPRRPRVETQAMAVSWARRQERRVALTTLCVGAGICVLVAANPLGVISRVTHFTPTANFVVVMAIGAFAYAISSSNQTRMYVIRELHPGKEWLPRRIVAASAEPSAGLGLSALVGAPGAMAGVAAHQLMLRMVMRNGLRGGAATNEIAHARPYRPLAATRGG
jgi:hypothetical protein